MSTNYWNRDFPFEIKINKKVLFTILTEKINICNSAALLNNIQIKANKNAVGRVFISFWSFWRQLLSIFVLSFPNFFCSYAKKNSWHLLGRGPRRRTNLMQIFRAIKNWRKICSVLLFYDFNATSITWVLIFYSWICNPW